MELNAKHYPFLIYQLPHEGVWRKIQVILFYLTVIFSYFYFSLAFSALTLLVGHHEEHWPVNIER